MLKVAGAVTVNGVMANWPAEVTSLGPEEGLATYAARDPPVPPVSSQPFGESVQPVGVQPGATQAPVGALKLALALPSKLPLVLIIPSRVR